MDYVYDVVSDAVDKVREKEKATGKWALVKIMEECLMRLEGYGMKVPKRFMLVTYKNFEEVPVYPPTNDVETVWAKYDHWVDTKPNKPIAIIDLGWCGTYRTVVKKWDPSIPV